MLLGDLICSSWYKGENYYYILSCDFIALCDYGP